jgi:mRNA-degrading endonuclease toxin of MazEF toxin-antitoxin module
MPGPLQFGRIVWTGIADANGIRKLRPAVIVTPSDRITPTAPLEVIAVTSRLSEPLPNDHVLLPWHAQGHPRTGLNRRCAAVCTWVAHIRHEDIQEVAGVVPGAVMLEILSKVTALLSPPSDPPAEAGAESSQGTSTERIKDSCGAEPSHTPGLHKPVGSVGLFGFSMGQIGGCGTERRRARRAQREARGSSHRIHAVLQCAMALGGPGMAPGIDGALVRRPERSCPAVPTGSNTPVRVPGSPGGQHGIMGTPLCPSGGSLVGGDRRTRQTSGPPPCLPRRSGVGAGPVWGGSRCEPLSAAEAVLGHAATSVLIGGSTLRRLGLKRP